MFTGIIEALGVVESIQRVELTQAPVVRLAVVTDLDVETLPIGASIAVDGVCLTAVSSSARPGASPPTSARRRWR